MSIGSNVGDIQIITGDVNLTDFLLNNVSHNTIGKGPTQTYWLHSETKDGAILMKPPDASKMLKPLFRPPRNIGGTFLY